MRYLLCLALILLPSACSKPTETYTRRYVKLEDIIIDSPDHDAVPITETEYEFGPRKVRFDDLNWRLYINDRDYGPVKEGDKVKLGTPITINGEPREPLP